MLSARHISFSRQKAILQNLSFSLKSGSFFGIVGPSGVGKSTLLKIIAGLLDADSGEIVLDGQKITGPKDRLIPGHPDIQLVNQDFNLDLYHTVYENLVLKTTHLQQEIREEYISELLELMELESLRLQQAHKLSGGEQQRLALARALALEPKVLLLDEPFAHLDAHIKRKISAYLLDLRRIRKTTLIIVSHDGQEILHLAEQIAYFRNGSFARLDSPRNFYLAPASYEEGLFFGELNRIKSGRKEILFRPGQYDLNRTENAGLQLDVSFKKELFFGAFTLGQFKFRQQAIYLHPKEGVDFSEIKTIFVQG
ncbi:MAG: ATP-binding cassette domain-containing protein [Bacteroidota bacterium]